MGKAQEGNMIFILSEKGKHIFFARAGRHLAGLLPARKIVLVKEPLPPDIAVQEVQP